MYNGTDLKLVHELSSKRAGHAMESSRSWRKLANTFFSTRLPPVELFNPNCKSLFKQFYAINETLSPALVLAISANE